MKPSEFRMDCAGLFRCCVETVFWMTDEQIEALATGDTIKCLYCKESSMVVGADKCIRWVGASKPAPAAQVQEPGR